MQRKKGLIATAIAAVAVVAATAGFAASGDDDAGEGPDTPLTGAELDRASAAALEETGGGRVTETEAGDEESTYEVEVTLDEGTQVDVQLDESFAVVSSSADSEHGDESGDG